MLDAGYWMLVFREVGDRGFLDADLCGFQRLGKSGKRVDFF
ncbi:hypothetical protein ES703_41526 [subsurface metagenome]